MAHLRNVSVASLKNPEKAAWITKRGGNVKNWKRRWCVLQGDVMFYFATQKDSSPKGSIQLERTSKVAETVVKKKQHTFQVVTVHRTYYISAESKEELEDWLSVINTAIKKLSTSKSNSRPVTPRGGAGSRNLLTRAKREIKFLENAEATSKVLEFWTIWSDSIPGPDDYPAKDFVDYSVSVSAHMDKITWRSCGPQKVFIQRMVDFFWNVGAPESEIDRLNEVGAIVNPVRIGSWIDMSNREGMDGGWYFPGPLPFQMATEAADEDSNGHLASLKKWAESNNIENATSVGRDMGAAPPRQTEIRVELPGRTFKERLEVAKGGFKLFGFPELPEDAMTILKEEDQDADIRLCFSIVSSSDGPVRAGILYPNPSISLVVRCCNVVSADKEALANFEGAINVEGPAFAEWQYLKEGFGYKVYNEGFNFTFHYDIGSEPGSKS